LSKEYQNYYPYTKRINEAIYDQAGKVYPVELPVATIEEWRSKLAGGKP